MLRPGSPAPPLSLPDQHGNLVSLEQFRGKHPVVLFFYPKDDTPVCTIEVCAFRDSMEAIEGHDAVVIGVSRDGIASHQRFAARWRLPFTLLSDVEGKANQAFEVHRILGLWAGRVTYVIDKEGLIVGAFRDALNAKAHVLAALEALDRQGIE